MVAIGACAALAVGWAGAVRAQEEPDPNLKAVEEVCGRCHTGLPMLREVRSWPRWNEIFRQMTKNGAKASREQIEQITSYFLDHQTSVNVNLGSQEELAWVLDLDDDQAAAILIRRVKQPFKDTADLASMPGIRSDRLALLGSRIQFDTSAAPH